ncbi:MAG TPA: ABC transporter permease [Gemmatimonadales bacterium]|nr:ABC transporter permease [Gemmatimonadales bacterium]
MSTLLQDLRFGARMFVKNPAVTAIAVVALGLGIGLTTTMFSIVYGALYRGLPFERPHELVHLERNDPSGGGRPIEVPVHDYHDWVEQQRSFVGLMAFYSGTINVSGIEGRPERFDGAFVTANAFELLGQRAMYGRVFVEGEDRPGSPNVAVLGYEPWRNRFNSDPGVVGTTVRMNGQPTTIVGVMPRGFAFPISQELWMPMKQDPATLKRGDGLTLEVVGRLRPGVSIDEATAEMNLIAKRLGDEYPVTNAGLEVVIKPYTEEYIGEEPIAMLFTMLAAVFLVLLIACGNVANLLLARATVRSKEVAVRAALGATRLRVITQFLTETFVIAAAGAALGLGIAWLGVRLFNLVIAPTEPPFWIDIRIDPLSVGFVLLLALASTLLSGVFPALRASGGNVHDTLKDEARGSSSLRLGRMSRGLVVAEIALSCGLLVAAGLTIKSVVQLRTINFGFRTDVLTARVGLFEGDYPDADRRRQFFDELDLRLAALPGVEAVALATSLPALGSEGTRFAVEGVAYAQERDYPLTRRVAATPGYFATFGVGILQGRGFTPQDRPDALPVAIVNQSFAAKFFPNESPLGRRIREGTGESTEPWRTIVGVVPDMYLDGIQNEQPAGIYIPLAQTDRRFMSLILRTTGEPMATAPAVRDAVISVDPDLPIYFVRTVDQAIRENTWFYRVFGGLFMVFGAAALFLGGVGLYGVMSFSVSRRTQELGIRMALGAEARDVLRLILSHGMGQLGLGLLIGLVVAGLLSQGLELILFDVQPLDPMIFTLVSSALFLIGVAACYVPARRATRVDPVLALRYE